MPSLFKLYNKTLGTSSMLPPLLPLPYPPVAVARFGLLNYLSALLVALLLLPIPLAIVQLFNVLFSSVYFRFGGLPTGPVSGFS